MISINYSDGRIETVHYRDIFRASPHNYILFAPNPPKFTMLDISNVFLKALGMTRESIVGKDLFDVFPDNPNSNSHPSLQLEASLMECIATKTANLMAVVQYDIPVPGTDHFQAKFWSPENCPVLDKDGHLLLILHTAVDLTPIIGRR